MKGSHDEQARNILVQAAVNKAGKGCPVHGCSGRCHGWITTLEAHAIAINHTARFRGLRLAGWAYNCHVQADKNNIFHFLYFEPQQKEMFHPRMVDRLVGIVNPGIELYERIAA